MLRSAFRARAWSIGIEMGSPALSRISARSSSESDLHSLTIWAVVSPPLVIERTLLMPSVRRFRVHLLASELPTLELATWTKVIGYIDSIIYLTVYVCAWIQLLTWPRVWTLTTSSEVLSISFFTRCPTTFTFTSTGVGVEVVGLERTSLTVSQDGEFIFKW